MNKILWSRVFSGMFVWKKYIDCKELTLLIPEYSNDILDALVSALENYLKLGKHNNHNIMIVCADSQIKAALFSSSLNLIFVEISKIDMQNLMQYVQATSKHYGVPRNPNVKIVSFDCLFSRQLRIIADSKLYPVGYLITEMILNRI